MALGTAFLIVSINRASCAHAQIQRRQRRVLGGPCAEVADAGATWQALHNARSIMLMGFPGSFVGEGSLKRCQRRGGAQDLFDKVGTCRRLGSCGNVGLFSSLSLLRL